MVQLAPEVGADLPIIAHHRGDLTIDWRASDDHVLMTGPVEFEREGTFDPSLFAKVSA